MGTVRRRYALDGEASPVLVSASIPDQAPNTTARCAYDLMNEAVPALPATLDATRARKLAADIVATCKEP